MVEQFTYSRVHGSCDLRVTDCRHICTATYVVWHICIKPSVLAIVTSKTLGSLPPQYFPVFGSNTSPININNSKIN